MIDPRRWPWWGWALLSLVALAVGLLSAALIIRQQGMRDLRLLVAELQRDGAGASPADLIAMAPPVDAGRQARAWALINSSPFWDSPVSTWGMNGHFSIPENAAKIDGESARILNLSSPQRSGWRTLYHEGPVVIGLFGWLREDLPRPQEAGMAELANCRHATVTLHGLARAMATEARTLPDPRAVLGDLDVLVDALEHPGCVMDAMLLISVATIRDDAWLEASLRGVDPAPWIAANHPRLAGFADALRGERLLFSGGLQQDVMAGRSTSVIAPSGMGTAWWDDVLTSLSSSLTAVFLPGETAFLIRSEYAHERLFRMGEPIPGPIADELRHTWKHPLSSISLPNLTETGISVVTHDCTARRMRLAGLLIAKWRMTHALPADAAELSGIDKTHLAAATANGPRIEYERLSPTRFRLWVDPATPSTDLLPAGRILAPVRTTAPWSDGRNWWLELDLAGTE